MADAAVMEAPAPGRILAYPAGKAVEFLPWIRTESLETHVLVSDLVHHLGGRFGRASEAWRRRLEAWSRSERIVDQYAADGTRLATWRKRVAPEEVWRLSLGRADRPVLEYGILVLRGPYALCHFQVVGPRTFATCHSRRDRLEEPPRPRTRWVPLPPAPDALLSLLLINCGAGPNRITLSRPAAGRPVEVAAVTLPRLGSRLVCLQSLFPGVGRGPDCDQVVVDSTSPYDFYTIVEPAAAPAETFSIQHVK